MSNLHIGQAHRARNENDRSLKSLRKALEIAREIPARDTIGEVLYEMGKTRLALEDLPGALEALSESVAVMQDLKHPQLDDISELLQSVRKTIQSSPRPGKP